MRLSTLLWNPKKLGSLTHFDNESDLQSIVAAQAPASLGGVPPQNSAFSRHRCVPDHDEIASEIDIRRAAPRRAPMPLGNVPGGVPGDSLGNVPGDVAGNVPGNVPGDSLGNVPGYVAGYVLGDVRNGNCCVPILPVADLQWTGHQSVNRAGMYPATFPGLSPRTFPVLSPRTAPRTFPILFPATSPRTFPLTHSHRRRRANRRIALDGWELKIRIAIAYKATLTAARIGHRPRGRKQIGMSDSLVRLAQCAYANAVSDPSPRNSEPTRCSVAKTVVSPRIDRRSGRLPPGPRCPQNSACSAMPCTPTPSPSWSATAWG